MTTHKNMLPAMLIILAGVAWFYGEIYWIGLAARWFYHPMFYFRNTSTNLHMLVVGGLSTILIQLAPSLIIAWLISIIKPKRWRLYSVLVILPTIVMSIITLARYGLRDGSIYWISYLVGLCALLVQIPLLLFLFYKINNAWNKGSDSERIAKQA